MQAAYGLDHCYDPNVPRHTTQVDKSRLNFLKSKTSVKETMHLSRPHSVSQDLTAASSKSNEKSNLTSDDFAYVRKYPSNFVKNFQPIKVIQTNE